MASTKSSEGLPTIPSADCEDEKDDTNTKHGADEEPAVMLLDDTATSCSSSSNNEGDEDQMPLLKYTRVYGSLPRRPPPDRTFASTLTCSAMGQVLLTPETTIGASSSSLSASAATSASSTIDQRAQQQQLAGQEALLSQQPLAIVAMGFDDGQVSLLEANTGASIIDPSSYPLRLRDTSHNNEAIVDVGLDSSGTFLCAIDSGRMVVIWEFKYTTTTTARTTNISSNSMSSATAGATSTTAASSTTTTAANEAPSTPQQQPASGGWGFMSAFTGGGSTPSPTTTTETTTPPQGSDNTHNATTSSSNINAQQPTSSPQSPRLTTASVQLSRISYPRSFGTPTCIAMDPAYKRRREKAVLAGFLDGRLVLTKRGAFFQRRTDAVIYQGTYADNNNTRGIEAIEWRGALVAWADASGIRLFDIDTLTRIAHIDRPAGARPTLYPTLSSIRPTLRFETSDYLLVAWGDCLMGLSITDNEKLPAVATADAPTSSHADGSATPKPRRRTVECAMAWELDCVACGAVPLDSDHALVLGIVTPSDDENDTSEFGALYSGNQLEVQIIAKEDGSVTYSNVLPTLRQNDGETRGSSQTSEAESAAAFTLLSSFALPRMEDAFEAEEEETAQAQQDFDEFDINVSLFSPTTKPTKPFVDSHLKWNIKALAFDDGVDENTTKWTKKTVDLDVHDSDSVDSDDYGFVFRPLPNEDEDPIFSNTSTAPLMMITSGSDAILTRMRDIDDDVAFALSEKKSAVALQRALRWRRRLRRFELRDLVNEYFISLLRIPGEDSEGAATNTSPLSIRRLKLAARSMPVLFGANTSLWERWVLEMEKIPGALFILCDYLPVRDPKLPKDVYRGVLRRMLTEIEELSKSSGGKETSEASLQAEECFLGVLGGWGPTDFLKEHIKLCKYQEGLDGVINHARERAIRDAEEKFARRFRQTSAGYLRFPASVNAADVESAGNIRSEGYYDTKQSLFDVEAMIRSIAPLTPIVPGEEAPMGDKLTGRQNSRVALDAMAKLNMMKGQYDVALKCFLTIGALHTDRPLVDLENRAIERSSTSSDLDKPWNVEHGVPYTSILDMIDNHHLQQCLLDRRLLWILGKENALPLFALIQLVGLEQAGNFLIEHCVAPQSVDKRETPTTKGERTGTLPLNLVASQLESSQKLLHWYLNLVFTMRPDVYVKFPNTAFPPRIVTELHRKHFHLYIKFARTDRDSSKVVSGVECYKVATVTTPLLAFIKSALPLGGIRPEDVKNALIAERSDSEEQFSRTFALELSYVIEHFGNESEEEAREILDLFMKGAESLTLAVSYAQRNRAFSSMLWENIIAHCLPSTEDDEKTSQQEHKMDGSLFGALLEAAALNGADLAKLVTQIPPGMEVEGLRPRLVAAVADYRLKLQMHEAASEAATQEMVVILREVTHRSRRGARYQFAARSGKQSLPSISQISRETSTIDASTSPSVSFLPKTLRTVARNDRHRLSLAPPMN